MEPPAQRPPLLVFADDWGRHPSSCQHLVRHLLPHREVVWVNTIGTRPPRLDWSTAKRVLGKAREWAGRSPRQTLEPDRSPLPSPRVVAPKMWPSFRSRFARGLNRRLLLRALRPVVDALPQPPVVVTTLPLVADLTGELPAARWVYYCVDDFSVWPGYDGDTMLRMERDLVPKVDAVIAVSDTLVSHVAALGKPAHLLTHGVDLDRWRVLPATEVPAEFAGLTPPFVVFWGVIDRRMDAEFVRFASHGLTMAQSPGTIVLVGPQEDPDPELFRIPRVAIRPPVPFDRLPAIAAAAGVLIMPYVDAPVTRAMQPLKLKEYLATRWPVVVRDLPATRPWGDCCDLAATPEEFGAHVCFRVGGALLERQQSARARLDAEGWAGKAKQFEAWVDGEGPAASG